MGEDVEVRKEDQLKINEFGRLNAKLQEVGSATGKFVTSLPAAENGL